MELVKIWYKLQKFGRNCALLVGNYDFLVGHLFLCYKYRANKLGVNRVAQIVWSTNCKVQTAKCKHVVNVKCTSIYQKFNETQYYKGYL